MALILLKPSKGGKGTLHPLPHRNTYSMAHTLLSHQANLREGYDFCPFSRLPSCAVETDHLPAQPN